MSFLSKLSIVFSLPLCNFKISCKMKILAFLCVIISMTSCKSRLESFLISDIKKDGLFGNVRSIETYAYKKILIKKPDTAKPDKNGWLRVRSLNEYSSIDTIFEILLSKTLYNQQGNRMENNEYQTDKVLATWNYSPPDYFYDVSFYRSKPQIFDDKLYKHLKYNYSEDNILESIKNMNPDGSFKFLTEYHYYPLRKKIIDSTFYENRGLAWTTTKRLTKYGIYEPIWLSNKTDCQFDSNNNIIVEGTIHYYYDEYDEHGNWVKLTKFYQGEKKGNPVHFRRVIEYY